MEATSAKTAAAAPAGTTARLSELAQQGYGLHLKLALAGAVALFVCIGLLSATLMYRHSAVLNSEIERASVQLQKGMVERGVLLAELYVTSGGVGFFTSQFTNRFQPDKLFAMIAILAIIAVSLNELARRAEIRASRWRE